MESFISNLWSMEQILSRYGYSSASAEHKQKEQQLLLCSSHENEAVVYLCIYKHWKPTLTFFLDHFCLIFTWFPLLQLRNEDYVKSEVERLQLAIEYVIYISLW